MPILTNDDAPLDPWSGALVMEHRDVVDESSDSLLERRVVSRPTKVCFQSMPFQYDAGRALFHEKVRHRVDFGRADFEREMKPRFLHKVLCHSTVKRSIENAMTRG